MAVVNPAAASEATLPTPALGDASPAPSSPHAPTLPSATFAGFVTLPVPLADVPPAVPGYTLVRAIAQGGMGTVWLAEHATLRRTVALKVMRPELARDPLFVERFVREARSAARVNHPGVVTVHDAGVGGGHLYLAMEYVPGGDLAARVARGRLGEAEALPLIVQVAEALQAIHDAGLVHRDLKPENILLDEQGRPRIADLGLARASEGDDRMTQTGQALGTPAYMSPEQANGASDIDARSDVYSLAATLYALLTGAPPFTGPTPWATVAKVINDPPPDPRAAVPALSPAVAAAIVRALAKDRAHRQPSASAFVADLTAPSVPERSRWWRHRWVQGIAAAYLLVALIGTGAALSSRTPPRASEPPPTRATPAKIPAPATAPVARADAPPRRTEAPAAELGTALRSMRTAVRGTVLDMVDGKVETVHRAVVAALRRNGVGITLDRHDALAATIEAAFADRDEVRVTLTRSTADTTQVAIQIGAFGDERRSRLLIGWIRDEL